MMSSSQRYHRRSIRLQGYDYSRPGAYFITICTKERACVFGNIAGGEMCENDAGRMVGKWWAELNRKFPNVDVDKHVVMPNHVHGIIRITHPTTVGANLCVRPHSGRDGDPDGGPDARPDARPQEQGAHTGAPLPTVVQWFKTMTTNQYIQGVRQQGWPPFAGKLWQRNYYEHIIRDESSLQRIREYISMNPACWAEDTENPAAGGRRR